ncbi:MAG: hypothetical protein SOX31_06390 [Eubacteriales bacterium]|nr:hypothetical protein [Eubacteriales bacterium]
MPQFFILDGAEWDAGLLGNMTEDLLDTLLRIALETAIRIA